ncbi:unnamed protein product [Discula destructiva]
MTSNSKPWAVVAGVGPGTGAAVARKFGLEYPIALIARNTEHLDPYVKEINDAGGRAISISTDVSDASSIKAAFDKIEAEFGNGGAAAAVFNASGPFVRKSLLELSEEEFTTGYHVGAKGAFLFSQAILPHLLKTAEKTSAQHPPTLIFTGATASVKSNALMSAFSTGKYALRALSFSIAREFASKGVHVAHAIIDGIIDTPRAREYFPDLAPEAKISPEGIADSYWNLHTQPKTTFTNEIDIRPMLEKW